jgi:hypothetical protein
MMSAASSGEKLKVFVSYSRSDSSEFVDELVVGLELVGFAPFLDRQDIAPGEPWEERLSGLIHQADTVVYVNSAPDDRNNDVGFRVARTLDAR